jgi:hypothetical protein
MSGPEIDIEAVTYSAVGSVNSKKFSNVLPAPGVLVLGNETLSASPGGKADSTRENLNFRIAWLVQILAPLASAHAPSSAALR